MKIPMNPIGFYYRPSYDNTITGHKRMFKTWAGVDLDFCPKRSAPLSEIFFIVGSDKYDKALAFAKQVCWFVNEFDGKFSYMPEKYVVITISGIRI